jgi:hypothetical protein
MSFKQLILQKLEGKFEGKFCVNSGVNLEPQKTPKSLPQNNEHKPKKIARIEQNCKDCTYHDTGPDPFGKDIIHWCGPWYEANGDMRYWSIVELAACPMGRWGKTGTVH